MNLVLDASVALSWAFDDEEGEYGVRVLEELRSSEAVVASLWPLEMTNGLLTAERRGRMDAPDARRFLHLLLALPIVVDPVARRRAFEGVHALGRTHGLTSYDAAYLELAIRYGLPVATLDEPLRKAVRAEGLTVFKA